MTALPTMREADLMTGVIDLARLLGYRVAHFRPAMTSHGWRTPVAADAAGFPDILMIRPGRIVAAELKAERGILTAEQAAWLDAFRDAGVPAYVWRPADYPDVIAEALR